MKSSSHLFIGIAALALVLCIVGLFERLVIHIDKNNPSDAFLKCEIAVFVLVLSAIAVTHALHWIRVIRRQHLHSRHVSGITWKELFQLIFLLGVSALIIAGTTLIFDKATLKSSNLLP